MVEPVKRGKATKAMMETRVNLILSQLAENVFVSQNDIIDTLEKIPDFRNLSRGTIRDYIRKADSLINSKNMKERKNLVRRILAM